MCHNTEIIQRYIDIGQQSKLNSNLNLQSFYLTNKSLLYRVNRKIFEDKKSNKKGKVYTITIISVRRLNAA